MSLLKRFRDREPSDTEADDSQNYHEMSNDEFFETIREENAERLGVDKDEMDDMSFSEIEERLGIRTGEVRYPTGSPEGYLDTDRYDVLSSKEYAKRKEIVEEFLTE